MRTLINWLGKAMVSIVFSLVVLNTCADGISPIAGDNYGTTLDFNEGNNTSQFTFFGGPYTMSTELRDKITFDLTSLPNWVTVYAGSWNQVVNGLLATDSSTILVSGQANNIYGRYGYGFDFVYAVKCAANYGSARSCSFSFTRKIVKGSADWSASRWSGVVTIRQEASSSVTYTITYKPGSYSSGNSVSDTKQSGVPLTLRDALFTRTGYTQEGWSTSTYGASKTYSLRGTYTADASTTLYPYWVGKSSTVTLDKQGGTGGTTSKTATYGSAMPSITPPTRDGYVFGGYYSGTNGSGTKYYNADGSSAHNCDFTSAKTLYAKWTQHTATNYALLVGINKYSLSGAGDLDGCVADALSMRMVCTDYGKWNKDNIVVLTNHLATLTRFRQEVSSLASIALPGDTVLIYDSGHGGAEKDAYGNYTKNSFICAYDDLYYDSVFATDLAKFNSGVKVVVMFDTCNSGGMFKSVSTSTKGESPVGNFLDNFIANASATIDSGVKSNGEKGSIASSEIGWIAAADYNVTSTDLDGMGLFTGFMVVDSGVLAGNADANSDGKITFKEIYDHAVVIAQQHSLSQMAQAANTSVLSSVDLTNKHIPLTTALDSANLSFSTSYVTCERLRRLGVNDGPDSWIGQSLNSGSFARSAVLANSSDAKIKVNVSGAGELSFKWKVSSELTYDKLSFIVDGVTNSVISGEKAWAEKVCSVGAGQHEFSWAYSKDGTVSKGEDCAWLDAITWTPTQTYTVYYKPGSNGSGSQKTATKTHGVTLTLLGETFTREGYTQTGWATTDGGAQAYALGAEYDANAALTLYPVWTPNTYTITYKPGSNGSGSQKTATKTHDVTLTLLGETFTRDGYTQTGWAATDGGAQVYPLNGVYTANAAATFYPVWTPIAKPQPTSEEIASALDCDYIDFVQEVSSSGTPYWMPETGNGYTGGETLRVEGLASNHWSSVITTVQGPCVVGWEWGCAKNDSECLLRMFADGDYQNPIGATNDGKWHMCYWEFADGECHTLDCCFAQGRLNSSGEGGLALYDTMAVYYQVSFDSNGGNGSAIAENGCVTKDNGDGTTNRYYEVGTSLTLPSGEGVTRGGFTFEGWTVDGDDTVYAPGDTYPVEMSPIVFKAKWAVAQTYIVTYSPGANGVGSQKTATKTHGVTLTLLGETFTREGYTQTGWATTDGGAQAYALGAEYDANAALTLYPVWTPNTYTITYKPGSNGSGSQKTATKTHDVTLTLLGETFTRDGYTQTGWAATDGGAQVYPLNGVYTANAVATFYPVWTAEAMPPPAPEEIADALDCCLLDFYAEVSTDGVGYWRPSGANMIISGLASDQWSSVMATANGPCFVDWNWACVSNKSECGLFLFVDNEVVDMARSSTGEHSYRYIGDGEHTLDWCFIQGDMPAGSQGGLAGLNAVGVYYPITYDLNGAEGSLPIPPEWYYRHVDESGHTNFFFEVGGEVSLLSASGLSKPGYSFVGWECSLDGEVYEAGEGYVVPDEPTVFTAKWEVAQTYTVTYRPGANGVGSQKTSVKAHGVALQLLGATFTRTGYTQTGWSTTDGGAQAYALNAMYAANAAMTLYPVWTANTYMVAFSANGGDGSMEAQSFTYDVAQNLRPNAFTREGYDFLGWAWTPTNEVPQFADGEAIKNLVEFDGCELTLFAVWSEIASSDPVPANYVTVSSSTYYGEGLAFPYDNIDYALTYANPSDADPISTLVISNVLDEAFDCTCAAVGSIVIAGERFDDLSGVMEGRDTFTLSSGVKVDVSIDPDVATRTVVWTFTASSSSGKGVLLCPGQTLVANYSACPCNVLGDDFIGYEIGTEVYFIADGGVPVYSETPCVNVIACQPDAPTGLTVSFNKNAAGNNYLATLAWDPEWPDNTRYIIYRSDSILIDWDNPYDETTGVSYTDPDAGLVGGNTKYYAVCACPTGPYIQGCGATVSAVVPVLLEPKEMSYDIDAEGVAVPEVVDVKANCEWQFETNSADAWLHILKSSASALTFTVDPNDGEARSSIVRLLAGTVVVPVTFSQKAVQVVKYTVTFDANGGACEIPSKIVGEGEPVGELPVATYAGHSFVGWFTEDGMQVSANTIVNGDVTYFAHWVPVVEQPAWTPVVKGMNLTLYAQVYDKAADAYLDAEGSVLAAFDVNGECRGKVAVMTGPNGIRVYQLTIGYESSGERGVTLKLWDAASGEIIDIPASEILYAPSQLIGKIAEPVVYQVGVLTQEITLNEGWNWVSTFLTVDENDVGTFFGDFEFADDDVVKGEASSATYFDCAWYPDDFMIEPCRAYVVKKSAGGTESHEVEGFATEGAISVDDGWNWFGSCSSAVKTVADLRHSEGFSDDDIIKGALESATYKNGNWYPSTMQLKPGVGYLAKLANGGEFTFEVGVSSANAARNALVMKGMPNEQVAPDWKPVVKPGTFTVYARAKDAEGNYIETDGSLLAAFDGNGECRGVCAIDDGPSVKFYQLNIGVESDGEPPLTLKVWNAADGSVSEIGEKVSGNINDLIGTISVPIEYQIASGDPTPAVRSADFGMTFNGKSLTVDVGKQPSTWSVVGSSPIAGNYVESANGFALDLGTCSAGPNISVSPMIDSGKSFAISYFGTIGTVAKGVVWALRYSSDLQGLVFQQGAAGTLQLRWMKSKSLAETAIALTTGIASEELVKPHHYLVQVSTGGLVSLYVDGVKVYSAVNSTRNFTAHTYDGLSLGRAYGGDDLSSYKYGDGVVDDFRVFTSSAESCLSDEEVAILSASFSRGAIYPELPSNPTSADVYEALDGSADTHLQVCITEPTVYNAYRAWAETVKAPGGSTPAGAQAVKDSPNAWLSFALDSATLIQTPPADGDVKVEKFEQTATAGSFDFTVGVENIPVGDDATPSNLAKVFGIEGGSTLSPQDMSSDKVDITFGTPENGKVKFTAGPKDKTLPTFFMKVKIK